MKRLWPLALTLAVSFGCAHAPPIHPRAVENNTLCAQYIAQGNLVQADVYCDLALEFTPTYADAWVNKGLIRLKRNQISDAKEDFIKALRYDQECSQAYNDLSYVYLQEGAFGRAHDNAERALKVNPDYTEARWNLAKSLIGLHKNEQAKKELRTIMVVAPNLADPYNALGILLEQEGHHDEAMANFQAAIDRDPNYAEAYLNLGATLMEVGKYDEAADAFTSCLKSDPDNIACRDDLPIANRKKALVNPELRQLQDQSEADPTAPGYYQLGQKSLANGLRAEAGKAFMRCLKVDGRYVPCHFALFHIYREDQDNHNANIACKNVLKFASVDDFPNEVAECQKFLSKNL